MPQPDDSNEEAIKRLDERLDAFETATKRGPNKASSEAAMGEGYRLLGGVIGGVLGGLGFGWLFDHFLHTTPWGMVAGLMLGTALSAYNAYTSANRTAAKLNAPAPPVVRNEDEDLNR